MSRKTGDKLISANDEFKNTQIYEQDADTRVLNPTNDSIKPASLDDSQVRQKQTASEIPTISWGNIGDYRITRVIGEGGMGIVYEAEQKNPQRLVALKVIRRSFQTNEYHIKLFEREIQALARLKHPGIAAIYESGQADDGQLFFAMELVRGTSLLRFVQKRKSATDESRFDVRRQLELFNKIAQVVSYAHQRGVIHRDLKPDNVLVTDESETQSLSDSMMSKVGVKILDFGLARINDPDIAGTNQLSQVGQIKGTLQYMSPEQVRGKPDEIDVRSDVYSLGVMLYEILTGQLPYDLNQASIPQAIRIICDEPPKTLGKALSEISDEGKKTTKIDKDVETIVLKAIEKEPVRRYQSVSAMIEDIERYLTNQPIQARPPSTYYQFRKLVARHKAAFASLAAIFLLLLGFGIVMAAQSSRLATERDRAVKAEQLAEEKKNDAEKARQNEQAQRLIAEENLKRAEEQQSIAEKEKSLAEKSQKSEQEQRLIAENNLRRAQTEQKRAEEQKALAQQQQTIAQQQKVLAEKNRAETETEKLKTEEQKTLAENKAEENLKLLNITRELAETSRRSLYVSQMNLAEQAWEQADIPQLEELLKKQIPQPGQTDLRGFEWHYLWNLANQDIQSFRNKGFSSQFSPDGKLLAVNTFENLENLEENTTRKPQIKILDGETGREIEIIQGRVFLTFLPDGKMLTIPVNEINRQKVGEKAVQEYPIEILDLKTKQVGQTKIRLASPTGDFLQFSPNKELMAQEVFGGIEIWEINSGDKIFSFRGEESWKFPSFTSGSKTFAIQSTETFQDSLVKIWDVATKKELSTFKMEELDFVALSPDGKTLATQDFDEKITFWDVATQKKLSTTERKQRNRVLGDGLGGLEFSPDGKILSEKSGRSVMLWGDKPCLKTVIKGFGDQVLTLAFSPDNKKLAINTINGEMKVWSISDCNNSIFGNQRYATFSSDGKLLATVGNNQLNLWDFANKKKLGSFAEEKTEEKYVFASAKLSPDGKVLAAIRSYFKIDNKYAKSAKTQIELWDTNSKNKLATLEENVENFAFSPNSKLLATANKNSDVHLWDVATQKKISTLGKGDKIDFSPDGKVLAIASGQKVKLIDISNGKETSTIFKVDGMSDDAVKFSPDGRILATIVDNNKIILWDYANQKEIAILKGHIGSILSMKFSPDSKRLVTASWQDETIRIWDLETQQKLVNFKVGQVYSSVFSPDGKILIVEGGSGLHIWQGATEDVLPKLN